MWAGLHRHTRRGTVFGAVVLASTCAAEPIILADTERNFRRSMVKVVQALGPLEARRVEGALIEIIHIRAVLDRLDRNKIFGSQAAVPSGGLIPASGHPPSDLARLVTVSVGRQVDGRSPSQITVLLERERQELAAAAQAMRDRMSVWQSALYAPPRLAVPVVAMPEGKLHAGEVSGAVMTTSDGARGTISFIIENRHERAIRALVFVDGDDGDNACGRFEYNPPLALRSGAAHRVIVTTTPRRAACAGQLKLAGFRDDRGVAFGAASSQSVSGDQSAWFYRTALFADSLQLAAPDRR